MILHVTWYYNLHGTKCYLVIHVSIEFYMVIHIKWYNMLYCTEYINMVLNITWYYMLNGNTCYMVLHVTWYCMLDGTTYINGYLIQHGWILDTTWMDN